MTPALLAYLAASGTACVAVLALRYRRTATHTPDPQPERSKR